MSNFNWYDHQQHDVEQLQPVADPPRDPPRFVDVNKIEWSSVFVVVVIAMLTLALITLAYQFGRMSTAMEIEDRTAYSQSQGKR